MRRSSATTVIGIDCATENKKLGLARGVVERGRIVVSEVVLGSEVESVEATVCQWAGSAALLAIDAPLGWPAALGDALAGHRAGEFIATERNGLFRRQTDRIVHRRLGLTPLDVGADRIARTAHRALEILGAVRERLGRPVPVVWGGVAEYGAIEIYPAATLATHGLDNRGYKGKEARHQARRRELVLALSGLLKLEVDVETLHDNDDRIDAAVCVLAGADYLRGRAVAPTAEERGLAEREGWIWVTDPAS